jgi:hypothetical protein
MRGATVTTVAQDLACHERWLRKRCDAAESDLKTKHKRMRKSLFAFRRASYFRWAKTIEATCPELVDAPRSLYDGDTHVENFGAWRDARARLVWGGNDFDEAAPMSYAYDLVRLLTSARATRLLSSQAGQVRASDGGGAWLALFSDLRAGADLHAPTDSLSRSLQRTRAAADVDG